MFDFLLPEQKVWILYIRKRERERERECQLLLVWVLSFVIIEILICILHLVKRRIILTLS